MALGRHDSASLPELLAAAARRSDGRGVAIFDRRARQAERRSHAEMLASAREAAFRWRALGVGPGDRVLACLPTSWDLVDAWLGAALAGAHPAILAPGGALGTSGARLRHVQEALAALSPRILICGEGLRAGLGEEGRFGATVLTPDEMRRIPASPAELPAPRDPEATAFLQLTSGSTGSKRAVVISHRALLHDLMASDDAIRDAEGLPASAWARSMVSWLPLHHDMGLVGSLLFSLACGFELRLMPPDAFLARPGAWLRELAAFGPSLTAAPSFALALCAERATPGDLEGEDLSGWKAAMIGAETISAPAAAAFLDAFAPAGASRGVLRPCYGLAEATLTVTCDRRLQGVRTRPLPASAPREGLAGAREVASTGEPILGMRVRIARPGGGEAAPGEVGEVLVSGPGLFSGYFGEDAPMASGGWLATGDLGFLHDGELHLAGRLKDLLIVRGENVMPQEIEQVAESAAGCGGSCRAAAFSVERDGGEQAIVVVESDAREPERAAALARAVRDEVGREMGLPLADVLVVRRGAIPRTTSGKLRRQALRQQYLENIIVPRPGAEAGNA